MNKSVTLLERHQPTILSYLMAKSLGYKPAPVLVTFKDAKGNIRREEVPL